jgi:glycosyltransferase involved in cell wall biosynthesis
VISCFNYGRFLPEAIESVKHQQGGPGRVIVVDDGSTDEVTVRALERVEADRDVHLIRQANAGASAARNRGLGEVQTPLTMVLDADDMLAPDAIARLRPALSADAGAGYAYGHIEFFGNWTGVMRMPPFDPWRLMFRHVVGPTALMRTEMVRGIGGYDVDFPHYEDWEIWVHALAAGWHGVQVDFSALLQRKHGPSKFEGDRANYRNSFARLRRKHTALYGNLAAAAAASSLPPAERWLYRWVWGPRPWPAWAENELYSLLWRIERLRPARLRSTTTIAR